MAIQVCTRCIMDNASDKTIYFDENGYCNYCTKALNRMKTTYFPNEEGRKLLDELLIKIKEEGKGKEYDCIMGISGGLDSSYLAYLGATKWNLRILAIHVDDGFDTSITKNNLEKLSNKANIELKVYKPDALQYNNLTKSFLRACVPNIAIPQDNIIFSYLHRESRRTGVKNFLSGGNFALESILEKGNTHGAFDKVNIKDIHKKYGTTSIKELPIMSLFWKGIISKYIHKVNTYRPLDCIDYNRDSALKELYNFCGFEYYGNKHLENSLTAFAQLYWFPRKFNVDKRKSHLSSMIVSGQLSREDALIELQKPLYDEKEMNTIIQLVKDRLDINNEEFSLILKAKSKQHTDYKTSLFNRLLEKYYFKF